MAWILVKTQTKTKQVCCHKNDRNLSMKPEPFCHGEIITRGDAQEHIMTITLPWMLVCHANHLIFFSYGRPPQYNYITWPRRCLFLPLPLNFFLSTAAFATIQLIIVDKWLLSALQVCLPSKFRFHSGVTYNFIENFRGKQTTGYSQKLLTM